MSKTHKYVSLLVFVIIFAVLGAVLFGTGHASETIDSTTWVPSGPGAYFFDRSNQTGNAIADFSAREAAFGRKFDGHMYYVPADATPAALADEHWSLANDHVPFVILSWASGNNPTNIIPLINQGAYDKDINDFASSVKSQLSPYGHVIIRPFWEFNYLGSEWNDSNYNNDPAQFIAAWQHVVNIFRADGVPNVKWDWNPNRANTGQSQNPLAYYPGSNYVDWIGIDAYPKNQYLTLEQLLTGGNGTTFDWYDTFKTYGKPLMVGETGIQPFPGYTRSQWWSDALTELQGPLNQIRALEYFDSNQGIDWMYDAPSSIANDSSTESLAAAKSVANNCYLNVLVTACGAQQLTPSVSITSPSSGSTLSGIVKVSLMGQNNPSKIELYIDNKLVATQSATSWSYSWDTNTFPDGSHTLFAKAYDSTGKAYPSTILNETVSNHPSSGITIVSPAPSSQVSGKVNIAANVTGNISKVNFLVDGTNVGTVTTSPYSLSWNSLLSQNGSHTITAVAYDTTGNAYTSPNIIVNVANISTKTNPLAAKFISPTNGSTVSGSVPVSLSVSGGTGGNTLQLILNGNVLTNLSTSPYDFQWDTSSLTPGSYSLQALAGDSSGDSASAVVGVIVSSSTPLPPSGLVATNLKATSLSLLWKAPLVTTNVNHYLVYRNNVVIGTPSTTSFNDTAVQPNTKYVYTVASESTSGSVSPMSAAYTVNTPALPDTIPPTIPKSLQVSSSSSTQINLNWTNSTDNVAVAGYKVFRNGVLLTHTSTNSFGDGTVKPSTTYSYYVQAYDAAGNTSPGSNTLTVKTPAAPQPKTEATGVTLEYYPNSDLKKQPYTTVAPAIAGLVTNPPLIGAPISTKGYTLRWVGQLKVTSKGRYTLFIDSSKGQVNLYIRNKRFIHDKYAEAGTRTVTLYLDNTSYNFVLSFSTNTEKGDVNMSWSKPGLSRRPIPDSVFLPHRTSDGAGAAPSMKLNNLK
ncbi:MAG TPA: Ig-like domain-containing protein [Candidatus Saccharimonadales bacterium]|nr:Ig-like domain-containing protein [Candidatus Saccharimonadales bacterium]